MFLCRFALKPNSPESGFVLVWRINQKVGSVCFQDDVFSALKPKNLPESGCSKRTGRQASVQPHYSRHVAETGKLPAEMFDHILFIDAAVHILIRERVCLVSSLESWTTVELLVFVHLLFQQNNVGTNQISSVKRQFSQFGEDELDCPAGPILWLVQLSNHREFLAWMVSTRINASRALFFTFLNVAHKVPQWKLKLSFPLKTNLWSVFLFRWGLTLN